MADFLSMLGGGQTANPSGNMFGLSPDQQAQMSALQSRAAKQAILPALFALGLGFLGHKRAINGLREGLAGAGNAYQRSYDSNINETMSAAALAQKQQRQQFQDNLKVASTNAAIQNANTNQRKVDDAEKEKLPLGGDPFASMRNDPQFKNVLFPPVGIAGRYNSQDLVNFTAKLAPEQQYRAQQILIRQELANQGQERVDQGDRRLDQGDTRNAIAQQNANSASKNANTNAGKLTLGQERLRNQLWKVGPVEANDPLIRQFNDLRKNLPPNIAATLPTNFEGMSRNDALHIYSLYTGANLKALTKQINSQQLANRQRLAAQYKTEMGVGGLNADGSIPPDKFAAYANKLGYDYYGNPIGGGSPANPSATASAPPAAAPSPAPASSTPNPAAATPTAAPTPKPAPSAAPALSPDLSGALKAGQAVPLSKIVNYLTTTYGMSRDDAIAWARQHPNG